MPTFPVQQISSVKSEKLVTSNEVSLFHFSSPASFVARSKGGQRGPKNDSHWQRSRSSKAKWKMLARWVLSVRKSMHRNGRKEKRIGISCSRRKVDESLQRCGFRGRCQRALVEKAKGERRGTRGGKRAEGGRRGREKRRSCQEFSVTLKSVFVPSDSHGRGGARLQECKSQMHQAYDTTDRYSIPFFLPLLFLLQAFERLNGAEHYWVASNNVRKP